MSVFAIFWMSIFVVVGLIAVIEPFDHLIVTTENKRRPLRFTILRLIAALLFLSTTIQLFVWMAR